MNILIDGHFLDGRKHGVANFIERLYAENILIEPKNNFYFLLGKNSKIESEIFKYPNVKVLKSIFGGSFRFIFDIPFYAIRIKADIIHTQYVLPLFRLKNSKYHITIHDVLYEDFPDLFSFRYRIIRHFIFGWSAKNADLISTISNYSKNRILKHYNPRNTEIHIIKNGANIPELDVDTLNCKINIPSSPYILYVSRFEHRKNHVRLLDAFICILKNNPGIKLVLVGFDVDGTKGNISRIIVENNISNCVIILSGISDNYISNLIFNASLVVYPSLCEGFGMPIIESLLLNSKTIFSNRTAMAEFSFAKNNMFDPYSVQEITQKIEEVLVGDRDNESEWTEQKNIIATEYSWVSSAKILSKIHSNLFCLNPAVECFRP